MRVFVVVARCGSSQRADRLGGSVQLVDVVPVYALPLLLTIACCLCIRGDFRVAAEELPVPFFSVERGPRTLSRGP